jgi:hypothetical protein
MGRLARDTVRPPRKRPSARSALGAAAGKGAAVYRVTTDAAPCRRLNVGLNPCVAPSGQFDREDRNIYHVDGEGVDVTPYRERTEFLTRCRPRCAGRTGYRDKGLCTADG